MKNPPAIPGRGLIKTKVKISIVTFQISHEKMGKINLWPQPKEDHPKTNLSLAAVYQAEVFHGLIRMLEFVTFLGQVHLFDYGLRPAVTLRKQHATAGQKLLIMVEGSMVLQLSETDKHKLNEGRLFVLQADDYSIVLPENSKVRYLLFHLETLITHVGWDQFPEGRFDLTVGMQAYLHAMTHPLSCPGSPEVWLAVQLINLLSELRNTNGSGKKVRDLLDYVLKADSVIRQHLTENITDNQIAKLVGYHETGLKAAFKTYFNMGMAKWQNLLRIERARQLIQHTDMSLREIQVSCGYINYETFRQNFTELTGLKPAAWRKKYKHEYAQ